MMLRRAAAILATCSILAAGCGGAAWPAGAVSVTGAPQQPITTIDVLPLDLELWTEAGHEHNPADLRLIAEARLLNGALGALVKRGYAVGAQIDWDGNYAGGAALAPADLTATIGALARYGETTAKVPGRLPVPYLPARLGTATGADATLYIGGWSYVAKDRMSTGEKVAAGIAIALVVVVVVAIVVAVLSDKGSSKSSGSSGGQRASTGVRDHRVGGSSEGASGGVLVTAGGGIRHRSSGSSGSSGAHVAVSVLDAFGRTAEVIAGHPDWSEYPAAPHDGEESKMYVEMTLVDNRTGLALWHAHQLFPASGASTDDVDRVARTLLASLPAR
jgi:hypothetical protein